MKNAQPKFRTDTGNRNTATKLILQCSECGVDIRELRDEEIIDLRIGYYCKDCDDGVTHINPPVRKK